MESEILHVSECYSIYFKRLVTTGAQLDIVTFENIPFVVTVSPQGWTALNSSDDDDAVHGPFESFESLFMSISPEFQSRFNADLAGMLDALLMNSK